MCTIKEGKEGTEAAGKDLPECGSRKETAMDHREETTQRQSVEEICRATAAARYDVQRLTAQQKNEVLCAAADLLVEQAETILRANQEDVKQAVAGGMKEGLVDRLTLTKERIGQMAEGLRQVAQLPDPVGEILESFERPNGLQIRKVRVPLGVIGMIYESRPNVTADAFALCFKAGNAVVLKGGSDALQSNQAITALLRRALRECGQNEDAVQLIATAQRSATQEFMQMRDYIDVLIPRGGAGLIRAVVTQSQVPVIETGTGNCHIYVDKDADPEMAVAIVTNAKTQRIGVCNAAESLVVHEAVKESFLPLLAAAMEERHVELRADEASRPYLPLSLAATQEDFGTEYLDYILSVKTVSSLEEAIAHINRYNTGHSDCIVTRNQESAQKFLQEVDSACVYVNASTRFTDGFEFGFGAEIGISTQKLHARGPMGLRELTSYKYEITGNGQVRG
ncbi:MAG: glutamate-5-semialdehyde dehydrogenase [Eubacteriales bacterium]|nr:glutamate-5-semialdehyde dehydrogenase [Eubacteriales bacterium]